MTTDRPRVLVIASYFPERSQTFVLDQVRALQCSGCEVEVLARTPGDGVAVDAGNPLPPTIYAELPDAIPARIGWALRTLPRWLLRSPATTWRTIDPRAVGPEGLRLRAFADLAALDRPRNYDVIYCHFGQAGLIGARLRRLGRISGELVVVFHGSDVSTYLQDRGEDAYDELRDEVALVLPVSDHWRQRLLDLGFDASSVRVHHMGIDPTRFTFTPRAPQDGPLRLLSLGRLVEKKAIGDVLQALQHVAAGSVSYTIAGDGPDHSRLRELATEIADRHEIRFLGAVDPQSVPELHESHDVFVAPSVTGQDGNKEGIPVAIMEAMASGMPVVSTWHSGIPELVEHGKAGLLVEEHDVRGIAEALTTFCHDRDMVAEMGRHARAAVVSGFNQQRLDEQLVTTLTELSRT